MSLDFNPQIRFNQRVSFGQSNVDSDAQLGLKRFDSAVSQAEKTVAIQPYESKDKALKVSVPEPAFEVDKPSVANTATKDVQGQVQGTAQKEKFAQKYVKTSEIIRGTIKGLISAAITIILVGGGDMLINGIKRAKTGEIEWKDIIKPSKSLSKFGKYFAPIAAGVFLVDGIIRGYLKGVRKSKIPGG